MNTTPFRTLPPEDATLVHHRESSRPAIRLVRKSFAELIGERLAGRYRLDGVIGKGGMGNVYAAHDVIEGTDLAIKEIAAPAINATNLKRFRLEAVATARLNHKNVCAVQHVGIARGTPYIVMERLVGETVRARVRETGPMPAGEAVSVALQMLDALAAAHACGVIHRDVKPGNVFLTRPRGETPVVKIIDFGLAKFLPNARATRMLSTTQCEEEESTITATDLIPGTPLYLTPEQVVGARDIDQRVDIWATGLTLFEMLVGRRVFNARSIEDLAHEIIRDDVPRISNLRADVPIQLDWVLAKALAKDRDHRFGSAGEFRKALVDMWARHRADCVARGGVLR